MGEDPFIRRILAAEADIPNYKLRNPSQLSNVERKRMREACSAIAEWPLHLDPTASLTCGELLARARMSIARDGARLIIVDHLGLVDGPGADNTKRLEGVSKAIRAFAKHAKVPVLQLSHLSNPKDKEINRRPTMLDLKYSGDIAGHSHVVLLLYVPEDGDGEPTGYDEIVAGKVREGCPGILPVRFNPKRMEYQVRTT
jgi:replicative DNA helicase